MSDEYKVVSEFCCCENTMVTVMNGNAAHVMSQEEWHKICSMEYQDRQKTRRFERNSFGLKKGYRQSKVS